MNYDEFSKPFATEKDYDRALTEAQELLKAKPEASLAEFREKLDWFFNQMHWPSPKVFLWIVDNCKEATTMEKVIQGLL